MDPVNAWCSVLTRRWNSSGEGGSQRSSYWSRARTRGTAPSRPRIRQMTALEHVRELRGDEDSLN